ncbi:MAG: hypothetical protein JO267_15405 [Alphaproteobacteria bacterium]|nr:hypothetical protein [Alphaproteobacteria bacterium]
MFPIADYREAERRAHAHLDNWRVAQAHSVDWFARVGFPVRIESPHEVGQLLDTMQEGRFEAFMEETQGLPPEDLSLLVRALVSSILFQMQWLPLRQPTLPLSTMMSSLLLYRKMRGFDAGFRRVLEVGPGCGYLSFFLRQHAALENYTQTEACESFYALQSMIDRHLFGGLFVDDVHAPESRNVYTGLTQDRDAAVPLDRELLGEPKCYHYPWWSLDRVLARRDYFDIVTANANLNEMSRAALRDYLALFRRVLAPAGIFLVQCTGAEGHGTLSDLLGILAEARFAPVFCAFAGNVKFATAKGRVTRQLCLNNIVMVREGNPLFDQCYGRRNFYSGYMLQTPWLDRMYFAPSGSMYTRRQVVTLVETALTELVAAGRQLPEFPC